MLWYQYSFRQYYPAQKFTIFPPAYFFHILLRNEFDTSSDEDLLLKSCCNQPHATFFITSKSYPTKSCISSTKKHKKKSFYVFCEIHIHSIIRPKHRAIFEIIFEYTLPEAVTYFFLICIL